MGRREPLRYVTILTNGVIIGIGLAIAGRALALVFPASFLLKRLQYRPVNILSYPFCLHQDLIKTTVSSRWVSSIYGLMVVICSMGLDSVLLLLSYILILKTVLRLKAKGAAAKALSTCGSHFILILFFSTILLVLVFTHIAKKKVSPEIPILLNVLHHVIPAALNPIVYGIRTQEIKEGIRKLLRRVVERCK